MIERRTPEQEYFVPRTSFLKRVSWGAIFAGMIVSVATLLALTQLLMAIGLSFVDPFKADAPSAASVGIGTGIAYLVSILLSLFFGGWVAGRLAGTPTTGISAMHGLVTWGLSSVAGTALIAWAAGSLFFGAARMTGDVVQAGAQAAGAAGSGLASVVSQGAQAMGVDLTDIQREAKELTKGVKEEARAQGEDPAEMIKSMFSNPKEGLKPEDRESLINVVQKQGDLSREEAAQKVDKWDQKAQEAARKVEEVGGEAKEKAKEIADAGARRLSQASLLGFIAMVLGAGASVAGGALGRSRDVRPDRRERTLPPHDRDLPPV